MASATHTLTLTLALIALSLTSLPTPSLAACSNYRIPPKLCSRCMLRPFDEKGEFFTSFKKDIYNWNTTACRKQLAKYVTANPCDTTRIPIITDPSTRFRQERLAVFLYSICEQCCDCVPIGAKPWQYEKRKKDETLIDVRRGNCAAHYHYDMCKIWPDVTRVIAPWGKEKDGLPEVCPQFKTWIESEDAKGWLRNPDADGLTPAMVRAMEEITRWAACREKAVWKKCTKLEIAQGRLSFKK